MKPVSGRRMAKILEARGWRLVRTHGSHYHYDHPSIPGTIPVPIHGNRDLKAGTQRSIMRAAGLTDDDL